MVHLEYAPISGLEWTRVKTDRHYFLNGFGDLILRGSQKRTSKRFIPPVSVGVRSFNIGPQSLFVSEPSNQAEVFASDCVRDTTSKDIPN